MTDTPVSELLELEALMDEMPDEQRKWLIDQMVRHSEGRPNVFDGTAPNPYEDREKAA